MSKKPCPYCDGKGKNMDNAGDHFVLLHEKGEKWHLCAEPRNSLLILKVKYCPMCGRRLRKKEWRHNV